MTKDSLHLIKELAGFPSVSNFLIASFDFLVFCFKVFYFVSALFPVSVEANYYLQLLSNSLVYSSVSHSSIKLLLNVFSTQTAIRAFTSLSVQTAPLSTPFAIPEEAASAHIAMNSDFLRGVVCRASAIYMLA